MSGPPTLRKALPVSTLAMGLVLALGLMGVVYTLWSESLSAQGTVAVGYTNADFVAASTNDPPGTLDPGYPVDVADCQAMVIDKHTARVAVSHAYPLYSCTFTTTIHDGGTVPERREPLVWDIPPELLVVEIDSLAGLILYPGDVDVEKFTIQVQPSAPEDSTFVFTIQKPFSMFATGTIGFWKNWDSHNTYSRSQIEYWLGLIDKSSKWLGPTTVAGMQDVFDGAETQTATMKSRFLAQYLATRLDDRSGRIGASVTHNVTGVDPGNYLGLGTPTSATLTQIISAIEAKYSPSLTDKQDEIMKNVCDRLNNGDI